MPCLAALLASTSAYAQEAPAPPPAADQEIAFSANMLDFDSEADIVRATGEVRMSRGGERLRADHVEWNRKTGEVKAGGNVIISNADGDTAFAEDVVLQENLRDGLVENLLIVLADGGRLVAQKGTRTNSVAKLDMAAYTPCPVVDGHGCPREPVWKISAVEVTHDPHANRVRYRNARLEVFGVPIAAIPNFSHPADDRGGTGILIPDIRYTQTNGFEVAVPYYLLIDRNRDLTITPHFYTGALPAIEGKYRALTKRGAYQVSGYGTYGRLIPTSVSGTASERNFRGFLESSGKFQLSRRWSITESLRVASDRTFMRRYDISRDDRLRSVVEAERVSRTSYLSISSWYFQTLRPSDKQGQIPVALPIIDYRKRIADPLAGGRVELQLNTIALTRTQGQDTQRAFAGAKWDLHKITGMGQEVIFTGYARADLYHTSQSALTTTLPYRGTEGWNGRFISAAAAEIRWPFVGALMGGMQKLTPRVQLVASPGTSNLKVPNEDARAVDLEDSNLFALNRFAGYDRWEDGTRITVGLDWGFESKNWRVDTTIGQSYRLSDKATLFPDGTGLTNRTSDVVGRTSVKYKKLVNLTHRFRLDKDNLAIRRNEIDATVGSDKTYATVGYMRLNRNIGSTLEDLQDREEVRLGGRVQLAKRWSVFGSTIVDMTGKREDPLSLSDGFQPIRHRLGFEYEDDCFLFGVTWRRDYDATGDAKRGNTFLLRLSFRNLGR